MAYITPAQIYAKIPQPKVNDALDDVGDGNAATIQQNLDQIIANAGTAVDGRLGARYATPFVLNANNAYPAIVVEAALIFACEEIYKRREIAGVKNPFGTEADNLRKRLDDIAWRNMPLDATIEEDLVAAAGTNAYVPGRITQNPAITY